MRDEKIISPPEHSQWANNIDMLLEGSTRWQYLQLLIYSLRTEKDTKVLEKLVILSPFPVIAVIVYLVHLLLCLF